MCLGLCQYGQSRNKTRQHKTKTKTTSTLYHPCLTWFIYTTVAILVGPAWLPWPQLCWQKLDSQHWCEINWCCKCWLFLQHSGPSSPWGPFLFSGCPRCIGTYVICFTFPCLQTCLHCFVKQIAWSSYRKWINVIVETWSSHWAFTLFLAFYFFFNKQQETGFDFESKGTNKLN